MNIGHIMKHNFLKIYNNLFIRLFKKNYLKKIILNYYSLGGSGPVIWSYFAEFQPKSKRGSMLSFMAAFWTLGNLFVAGKSSISIIF